VAPHERLTAGALGPRAGPEQVLTLWMLHRIRDWISSCGLLLTGSMLNMWRRRCLRETFLRRWLDSRPGFYGCGLSQDFQDLPRSAQSPHSPSSCRPEIVTPSRPYRCPSLRRHLVSSSMSLVMPLDTDCNSRLGTISCGPTGAPRRFSAATRQLPDGSPRADLAWSRRQTPVPERR
jgi:hypothetical protein